MSGALQKHMKTTSDIARAYQATNQAQFRNTRAEFFDPNAMQLHTACSTGFFRPTSGT